MTWGRSALAAVCVAGFVAQAQAQTQVQPQPRPQPGAPAATADQIAAARAEADRLIAAAGAQSYFADITDGSQPKVKHLPSGLECVFTPGQADNRIRLDPGGAPGESVTCETFDPLPGGGGAVNVIHVRRQAEAAPLDQQLREMTAALRKRWPGAKPLAGAYAGLSMAVGAGSTAPPPHLAARFQAAHAGAGAPSFERAAVGQADDWTVSQTVSAPLDDADTADLEGELTLSLALLKIQQAGAAASPKP